MDQIPDRPMVKCPWCGRVKAVLAMGTKYWCTWCQKLFDKESADDRA